MSPLPPTFPSPGFSWGGGGVVVSLSRTAVAAAVGLLLGLGVSPAGLAIPHREKPAAAEPSCPSLDKRGMKACNLAFSAGNQSRGLAGKWTVAPGGFIFRARQSIRVEAYNGVKEERGVRNWKEKPTNSHYIIYLCFLALSGFKEDARMRPLL